MGFKKVKLGKEKTSQKVIPLLVSILAVIIVFFLGILGLEASKNINFNLLGFLNGNIPNIVNMNGEDTTTNNERLNILVVGRGGGNHDAADLTDTIILASIDFKSNITTLFSIPRDLYVEYGNGRNGKINDVYRRALEGTGTEDSAMSVLEQKITQITGQAINYYVNIDFEGFIKLVDLLGGVEVTLDENFVDYEYPDGNLGYTTFTLRKGTWLLDGEVALKYVRSRHSTSDFDRSLRQQQVISSLKNKIISNGIIANVGKIKDFYLLIKEYVKTNLDIKTIISLALKMNEGNEMLSFNLNNSCSYGAPCEKGGFLYNPDRNLFGGASVLLPDGATVTNLENYATVQKYTHLVFDERLVYKESYQINIFNATKKSNLAREIASNLYKYGFNVPNEGSIGNTKGIPYINTTILYNNIEEDSATLSALKNFLEAPLQKVEKPLYSSDPNTKIEIILGDDYATIPNNF